MNGALQQYGTLIWTGLLFVMMYFFMIRPQQKEQRLRAEMIRALKPGDRIVTAGGVVGVITKVEDVLVKVRVAERVEIDVLKTGVARTLKD
ncbi:MAG: preprotein translocase subunit YajC [Bacillota bacterium]